mmetsp:Transcript_129868/g.327804  ORF Transcript_129868/g.327804 Transcript_129868/m.327804 type:complete len:256 (+) Transcript_129868:1022-1789(+)
MEQSISARSRSKFGLREVRWGVAAWRRCHWYCTAHRSWCFSRRGRLSSAPWPALATLLPGRVEAVLVRSAFDAVSDLQLGWRLPQGLGYLLRGPPWGGGGAHGIPLRLRPSPRTGRHPPARLRSSAGLRRAAAAVASADGPGGHAVDRLSHSTGPPGWRRQPLAAHWGVAVAELKLAKALLLARTPPARGRGQPSWQRGRGSPIAWLRADARLRRGPRSRTVLAPRCCGRQAARRRGRLSGGTALGATHAHGFRD